jgi:hypothetical protein
LNDRLDDVVRQRFDVAIAPLQAGNKAGREVGFTLEIFGEWQSGAFLWDINGNDDSDMMAIFRIYMRLPIDRFL